jgi:hypothetical protein
MRNRRRTRLLRQLVLGFAVALVAVPVAQAHPFEGATPSLGYIEDTSDSSSVNAVVRGDYKAGLGAAPNTAIIAGDDKRGIRTPTSGVGLIGDDKQNLPPADARALALAEYYRYWRVPPQARGLDAPQVVSNPSGGFDWGDAGIGAGTVFAAVLLGAGAVLASRHVGRPAQV